MQAGGRKYHIVGNIMSRLNYFTGQIFGLDSAVFKTHTLLRMSAFKLIQ